jgi:SPP1 family predicted phage head-tail adaptor
VGEGTLAVKHPAETGELRHRVTIESATIAQDTSGNDIKEWSTHASRWARVRTLKGRELIAAQTEYAEAECEIVVRFVPGLTESMRVNHGGTMYDILNANDVDRIGVWHVLTCATGVSETDD